MKVVGKRLLCIVLAVAMFGFSLQDFEVDTYAAEQEVPETSQSTEDFQRKVVPEEPDINREEAKDIAEFQLDETLKNQETEWKEGTKIRKVYNLYNEKEEICAYAVELKNGTKDAGYVVVGAVEENPPIIEFRTSGRFLDEELQDDEYLLYGGGIGYYKVDKDTKEVINIETDDEYFSLDDIEDEKEEFGTEGEKKEIQEEWTAVKKSAKVGSSKPPTSGDVNTSPYQYESGYKSVTRKTAPDATCYRYFVTTDLGPGGLCVPTAVCNLLKYYTERKRMKSSLLINNNWRQTFDRIMKNLKTDPNEGTDTENIKPGLDRYFREINIQDAFTHYYGYGWGDKAEWSEMKRRIDCGDPFIYVTCDHYIYTERKPDGTSADHAVLAVGYMQFDYDKTQSSGLKTSRYLQVADGWTDHANRYINVHVGNDASGDEMITLYFVYSYIQK